LNASWVAVADAGAMIVTLRTFVTLLTIVVLLVTRLLLLLPSIRMPVLMTGGAPTTTAGGVPIGAGTIKP
jgi:hypothetical protein